jgi:hypothetical protein
MLKQARIGPDGKIIVADRTTHVTRNPDHDGPDRVQFLRTPRNNDRYIIRFNYPQGSPFQPGSQDIQVPPGAPHTVTQGPDTYKYRVIRVVDEKEVETDDPDVIVD